MTRSEHEKLPVAVLLSGREKFGAYYGGALARWTHEVYRHLTDSVSVTVFGFPTADEDQYPLPHETSQAWRLCTVMGRVPLARRYEDHVWLRALVRRLRRFAIVHIHNRPQWAAMLRELGYTGSVIVHLQNDHLGHWSGPMLDTLATHVDAVVVCSGYLRGTFASKSFTLAEKTHVVFNGVNTELFHPAEESREAGTVFFVGRFDPEKGVLELVKAYARVLKDHARTKLVIGGTTGFGTHRQTPYVLNVQELARSVTEGNQAQIQFTGYIDHDRDLPGWFQRATVFCCPSLFQEPFGLVNAEAMACGTVVIGSERGGIPEVLGSTGYLVNPEDTDSFAAVLSRVLADSEDRQRLGQAARERALRMFDWRIIAGSWLELLRSIAKRSGVKAAGK